jgi:hypothetical protein
MKACLPFAASKSMQRLQAQRVALTRHGAGLRSAPSGTGEHGCKISRMHRPAEKGRVALSVPLVTWQSGGGKRRLPCSFTRWPVSYLRLGFAIRPGE